MQRQQKAKTALFVPSNSASPRFTWKRVKGRLIALSDRSDIKTKKPIVHTKRRVDLTRNLHNLQNHLVNTLGRLLMNK